MTDNNRTRSGSLQFYPRVRARKPIPSVNWKPLSDESTETSLLGFIGYKVGMVSVWAKDLTEDSLTKNKPIAIPATILECPPMRIFSIRFYKNNRVVKEVVVENNKLIKRKTKVPKQTQKEIEKILGSGDFDDIRLILFSKTDKTGIEKKKPDFLEVALSGTKDNKTDFIRKNINKDFSVADFFNEGLVDIRGVTKGKGTQGPVKRFGIALKDHKSEKGRRRPGSLAPWHPARVTFRAPQAGQTGYHTRISHNKLVLDVGRISEKDINKKGGFEHYGIIKTDFIILKGSIPGPRKRGVVLTKPLRPTKKQTKKKFEVIELR